MDSEAVELEVGGQTYRVVTSAEQKKLEHYARLVDGKLKELQRTPGPMHPQALVLAAIALAHDLEEERARRQQVETRSRQMLRELLGRVDAALDSMDEDGNPLPPLPVSAQQS